MQGQRENTVVAPGVGRVEVVPDAAQLDLTVEVTEQSPAAAYAEANAAVRRVVAVLDEHGVAAADRQTRRLTLRAHYEALPNSMTATLVGYRSSIGLGVRLVALDRVPELLDAVVEAGGEALGVGEFSLISTDLPAARAHAESAAVADARERAQRLAEAAGATVGAVIALRQDPPRDSGYAQALSFRASSGGAAIEAGEDTVVAWVVAEFALQADAAPSKP